MSRQQGRPLPLSLAQSQYLYLSSVNEGSNIPSAPSYRASIHNKHPLDIPGRIEQKLAQYNTSESVFKRWLFEIISVATSAICMGGIASAWTDQCVC
jgi:hypothetical protein